MRDVVNGIKTVFKEMNAVSKYAMKYGTALILTIVAMIIYFYIKSLCCADSISYTMLCSDLLYSIKEYIGSVYILPMLAEIIIMARKIG